MRQEFLMHQKTHFDVIIVGGSYSGLAAGMALGRAVRRVLIIDSGRPCNRQTPYSHNFLTQDGKRPGEIASLAKSQVQQYSSVQFLEDIAVSGHRTESGFEIRTASGEAFSAAKLIFATGVRDLMPEIKGFGECWGISVLHCPYCHGYEVRNANTGILSNGEAGFEFAGLISNWTDKLTVFTNGSSTLTPEQRALLEVHSIAVIETEIASLAHDNGHLHSIVFTDGTSISMDVLYAPRPFEQHCAIPHALGCELTDDGYVKTDSFQRTTVPGVYACGDNTTRIRTVANAVATGTTAGMTVNKEIVLGNFLKKPSPLA